METVLDYLQKMVQELYQQYTKYPAGKKIKYEIDLGEYPNTLTHYKKQEKDCEYARRLEALEQLIAEGIVLSYTIKTDNNIYWSDGEFAGNSLHNKIAQCLIDKNKLERHIKELSSTAKMKKEKSIKNTVSPTTKIQIFISDNYGIFMNKESKKPNYPIESTSKRLRLIKSLRDSKKNGKILADTFYNHNFSQLNKELKNININFKSKLKLKDDLIIKIETGGYKLNKDRFNIRFID